MNSTAIEIIGISALNAMLAKSNRIKPEIKDNDKYPSWDGEIIFYHDSRQDADNINYRVPVQVKGHLSTGEITSTIKHSVKISDLRNYEKEGGIVYIITVYDKNSDKTHIFMECFLKHDINQILRSTHKNQKTKSLEFGMMKNVDEIIDSCDNFNIHRTYQMNLPDAITELPNELFLFGKKSKPLDLLRQKYVYAKTNLNTYACVGTIDIKSFLNYANVLVKTETKIYYNKIPILREKNSFTINFNDFFKMKNNEFYINTMIDDETTIDRILLDMEFTLDILENGILYIGNKKIDDFQYNVDVNKLIETFKNNYLYFKFFIELLVELKIPLNMIKAKHIIGHEDIIVKLHNFLIKKENASIEDNSKDRYFYLQDFIGTKIILMLVKQEDGSYKVYDYMKENILKYLLVKEDEETVQLSRFYNLTHNDLIEIPIDFSILEKELSIITYNENTLNLLNFLLLEFILAYDVTKDIKYLNYAEKINKSMIANFNYEKNIIFEINKLQMIKRKRNLNKKEKDYLFDLKSNNDDINLVLCILILLGNIDEFNYMINNLSEEERNAFLVLPICNLILTKENEIQNIV